MIEYIVAQIESIMTTAKDYYNVDPMIFVIIYFICVPIFYFSLYKIIRALANREMKAMILWSAVFLASCVAPFIYVMIFGKNIPWWAYLIIVILLGQSIYSVMVRIRKKPTE